MLFDRRKVKLFEHVIMIACKLGSWLVAEIAMAGRKCSPWLSIPTHRR
jgi:hypothetical protein